MEGSRAAIEMVEETMEVVPRERWEHEATGEVVRTLEDLHRPEDLKLGLPMEEEAHDEEEEAAMEEEESPYWYWRGPRGG